MPASDRYAGLLRVDIARRDPLTGQVESPLSLLIPKRRPEYVADIPVSPGLPPLGLDLDDVPGKARPLDIDGKRAIGLSNAFGFGGHNAVLCLEAA